MAPINNDKNELNSIWFRESVTKQLGLSFRTQRNERWTKPHMKHSKCLTSFFATWTTKKVPFSTVIYSRSWAFVVHKAALGNVMTSLRIETFPHYRPRYPIHRFDQKQYCHDTLLGVELRFVMCKSGSNEITSHVSFGILKYRLAFSIGLLPLTFMQVDTNILSLRLEMRLRSKRKRFTWDSDNLYVYLLLKL